MRGARLTEAKLRAEVSRVSREILTLANSDALATEPVIKVLKIQLERTRIHIRLEEWAGSNEPLAEGQQLLMNLARMIGPVADLGKKNPEIAEIMNYHEQVLKLIDEFDALAQDAALATQPAVPEMLDAGRAPRPAGVSSAAFLQQRLAEIRTRLAYVENEFDNSGEHDMKARGELDRLYAEEADLERQLRAIGNSVQMEKKLFYEPGELIANKYRVLNVVSPDGGGGAVYMVQVTPKGSVYTLKTNIGKFIANKSGLRWDIVRAQNKIALANESEVLAAIGNAGSLEFFPKWINFGTISEEMDYLVMEYVDGVNGFDYLKSPGRNPEKSVEIVMQLLSALKTFHSLGFVFNDIKPGNLMIKDVASGINLKLVDFGDADKIGGQSHLEKRYRGTAGYRSPEQTQGQATDIRSDLYQAGIVLYRFLTDKPEISDKELDDRAGIFKQSTPGKILKLVEEDQALGHDVRKFLRRALAVEPEQRFLSAEEMRNYLSLIQGARLAGEEASGKRNLQADSESRLLTPAADVHAQGARFAAPKTPELVSASATLPIRLSADDMRTLVRVGARFARKSANQALAGAGRNFLFEGSLGGPFIAAIAVVPPGTVAFYQAGSSQTGSRLATLDLTRDIERWSASIPEDEPVQAVQESEEAVLAKPASLSGSLGRLAIKARTTIEIIKTKVIVRYLPKNVSDEELIRFRKSSDAAKPRMGVAYFRYMMFKNDEWILAESISDSLPADLKEDAVWVRMHEPTTELVGEIKNGVRYLSFDPAVRTDSETDVFPEEAAYLAASILADTNNIETNEWVRQLFSRLTQNKVTQKEYDKYVNVKLEYLDFYMTFSIKSIGRIAYDKMLQFTQMALQALGAAA